VGLLGLFICLVRRRWREGLFVALLGCYGYVFLVSFVMPRIGGAGAAAAVGSGAGAMKEAFGALVSSPGETLGMLGDPSRVSYLADLFVPLVFLPLLGPLLLAFGLPMLAAGLFWEFPAGEAGRAVQTAVLLPFLFAAAVAGLKRLKGGRILGRLKLTESPFLRWAFIVLPLVSFGVSPAAHFRDAPTEEYRTSLREVSALIPSGASLAVEKRLAARFAHREFMRILPDTEGVEWILIESQVNYKTDTYNNIGKNVLEVSAKKGYKIVHKDNSFILLSRNAEKSGTVPN
jgi:hypothetical protein